LRKISKQKHALDRPYTVQRHHAPAVSTSEHKKDHIRENTRQRVEYGEVTAFKAVDQPSLKDQRHRLKSRDRSRQMQSGKCNLCAKVSHVSRSVRLVRTPYACSGKKSIDRRAHQQCAYMAVLAATMTLDVRRRTKVVREIAKGGRSRGISYTPGGCLLCEPRTSPFVVVLIMRLL